VRAEHRVEQRAQVRALDRADELAQVGFHLRRVARRPVEQGAVVDLVGMRGAQRPDRDLPAVTRVDRVAAVDAHRGAVLARRRQVGDAVPHDRGHRAGAVAEREPQELAPVALGPQLALADQQHAVELLSVGEVAQDHGSKRRSGVGHDGAARRVSARAPMGRIRRHSSR
jgi:hypothetical protein